MPADAQVWVAILIAVTSNGILLSIAAVKVTRWAEARMGGIEQRVTGGLDDLTARLDTLNGSVARNTAWIAKRDDEIRREASIPPWMQAVDLLQEDLRALRDLNILQVQDLNDRRAERGLPPISLRP